MTTRDGYGLSDTMLVVLGQMRRAGGRIERWPGGFWTTPGTKVEREDAGYKIPAWWCSTQTVQALARRGVIIEDDRQANRSGSFAVGYRLPE